MQAENFFDIILLRVLPVSAQQDVRKGIRWHRDGLRRKRVHTYQRGARFGVANNIQFRNFNLVPSQIICIISCRIML